ncbi:Asp23/Gls24 family envelope stress response protein [Streptomyces flaveolus]|uniref:Asp23/Gls24 family envelope stress response protein n=1 Tax=Streptomyces flaveolus TaxID=67297 RepID=UPI003F4DA777
MAAREVPGIHTLGGGLARTMGPVRERVPGGRAASITCGVKAEAGEQQAVVDLSVVVEHGVAITDIVAEVRALGDRRGEEAALNCLGDALLQMQRCEEAIAL